MKEYLVYAVDFDGTLCENAYPDIGEPKLDVISAIKYYQSKGNKLILWSCREGKRLQEAIEWCRKQGLEFDAVNDNLPEKQREWGNNPRKVAADWYVDDRNCFWF